MFNSTRTIVLNTNMSIINPEEVIIENSTVDLPDGDSIWPTDNFARELQLMAEVVTRLELWDWFSKESPPENEGYMWWGHSNITLIYNDLGSNNNHSGSSFAIAMRNMQKIAKLGFSTWRKEYILRMRK